MGTGATPKEFGLTQPARGLSEGGGVRLLEAARGEHDDALHRNLVRLAFSPLPFLVFEPGLPIGADKCTAFRALSRGLAEQVCLVTSPHTKSQYGVFLAVESLAAGRG